MKNLVVGLWESYQFVVIVSKSKLADGSAPSPRIYNDYVHIVQNEIEDEFLLIVECNVYDGLRKDWYTVIICSDCQCLSLLSGVPDYFDRNKISSGGDLSHYSSASLY